MRERVLGGITVLEEAGYQVVTAPNLFERSGYLAGPDDSRVAGFDHLLDVGVDALLAARGGYGISRLLERLPYDRLVEWGGWVVGFSDVTALHCALARRTPFVTLHGPMASTLPRHPQSTAALFRFLEGRAGRTLFRISRSQVVRGGIAGGVAVGGNLAILAALEGSPWMPDCREAVLVLEDVGEPLYRLDRMLTQLRLATRLAGVKAIVAGSLTDCCRGERGWRGRWRDLVLESVPSDCVVVEGLPFGHGRANRPIPLGAEVEVDTLRGVIDWGGS